MKKKIKNISFVSKITKNRIMLTVNRLKYILYGLLIICLFIYHIWGFLIEKYLGCDANLISLNTIVRVSVSIFLIIFCIHWKILVKLFLRKDFIAGIYIGKSTESDNKERGIHTEEFEITQSLLSTEIKGVSKINDIIITNWAGKLVDKSKEGEYIFIVNMRTKECTESGLMMLNFNKQEFNGFYQSTNPNMRFICRVQGNKIK